MNMRELFPHRNGTPTSRGQSPIRRNEEIDPLLMLHREMNLLFDSAFRGFFRGADMASFGYERAATWPNVEVAETDREIKVMAELPGLDEKDVKVELSNNTLTIDGERKGETEDQNRWFSERYYGHFQRRIPLDWEVEEDKVAASFRNGVLTVILPKSENAPEHTKRIPVNGG